MKIVRLLPGVFNEIDIIEENLKFYIEQGFDTIVVDNGSCDGSYELCRDYLGRGVIRLERVETPAFATRALMGIASRLSASVQADWVVMADADEFVEPEDRSIDLRTLIARSHDAGATVIETPVLNFFCTSADEPMGSVQDRIRHYCSVKSDHQKIWRDLPTVYIEHPHRPSFPDERQRIPSSLRGIVRHYPLRSDEQARRKIERVRPSLSNPFAWGTHYLGSEDRSAVIRDRRLLHRNDGLAPWMFDKHMEETKFALKDIVSAYSVACSREPESIDTFIQSLSEKAWPSLEYNLGALALLIAVFEQAGMTSRVHEYRALIRRKIEEFERDYS